MARIYKTQYKHRQIPNKCSTIEMGKQIRANWAWPHSFKQIN